MILDTEISPTTPDDAAAIRRMSIEVGVFSSEEVATVDELLEEYFIQGPDVSGYHFLSMRANQTGNDQAETVGFACYGPRALTQGVYDLYWIVTNPGHGRAGLGGRLLDAIAERLARTGARMIIAETSGRADYAGTRAFYLKHGYVNEATIAEFYAPGDDLKIYVKRLGVD